MITLYFAEIKELLSFEWYLSFINIISDERKQKIIKQKAKTDKLLLLYPELLILFEAQKKGIHYNASLDFGRYDYGKPYIKGHPEFQFNISHTNNAIAVAFSEYQIGVDVEKIRTEHNEWLKNNLDASNRIFSKDEVMYILAKKNKQALRFAEVWTGKEAYLKCKGTGITMPLSHVNIFESSIANMEKSFLAGDYVITVCSEKTEEAIQLIQLSEADIVHMVLNMKADKMKRGKL